MDEATAAAAEALLGHTFTDRTLLQTAFTHPSYGAENGCATYDRLEFLGDAVLGFMVSDRLFRTLPGAAEGELTVRKHAVVAGQSLSCAAERMGLARFVLLGRGAEATGDRYRASVLENVVEAVVGALYLDAGLGAVEAFLTRLLGEELRDSLAIVAADPKSALQQHSQAHHLGLPSYDIVGESGPAHDRTFSAEVRVAGTVVGTGTGPSKQAAEKAAAQAALDAHGNA